MRHSLKLDPARSVLLIVDVQTRLSAAMPEQVLASTIKNIGIVAEGAKRLGVAGLLTEQYPKGLGPTLGPVLDAVEGWDALGRFEKTDFSVCAVSDFGPFIQEMKEAGRDQWIVAGMETHICVYQTARDLLAHNQRVHVLTDAVCSRSKHNYKVGLELMRECGAHLSSTETVVMDWLGCAGGEDFKAISKLIK